MDSYIRTEAVIDGLYLTGNQIGMHWHVNLRSSPREKGRDFLVTENDILPAIAVALEKGPPRVRADALGVVLPERERMAILAFVERWKDFVVATGFD